MKLNNLLRATVTVFTIIILTGCEHLTTKDNPQTPPDPPGPVGRMAPDIADKLGFDNASTDVVLSINRNGKIMAFVRNGVKVDTSVTFPIHADNILSLDAISVVKTSNPKVCWGAGGSQTCVIYPDP